MARRQRGYFDRDSDYEDNPVTMLVILGLPALIAAAGGLFLLTRKKPAPPIKKTEVLPSIPPPAKGTYRATIAWVELQDWQSRWFSSQGVSMESADIEAVIAHFVSTGKVPTESDVMAYLTGLGFNYTVTIVQQIISTVTGMLNPPTIVLPEPTSDEMDECAMWHFSTNAGIPTLVSVTGYFNRVVPPGGRSVGRHITQATLAEIIRRYQDAVNAGRFPNRQDIKDAIIYFCQNRPFGDLSDGISQYFKRKGFNPRDEDVQAVLVGTKNCAQYRPDPSPVIGEPGTCVLSSGFYAGSVPTTKASCEAVGGTWFPSQSKVIVGRKIDKSIVGNDKSSVSGYPTGTLTTKAGMSTKGTPTGAGIFTSAPTTKNFRM